MQTIQPAETTKVLYGVNELDLELAGKTVSEVWKGRSAPTPRPSSPGPWFRRGR
jgi:hypothetical protein